MSGIFGRVELGGRPIDSASFLEAFDKLKSYGPDASETRIEGPLAVGQQLLRISAASPAGPQVIDADGVIVVADVILDNRDELSGALGLSPARLAAATDPELVHMSYLRWGEDCVDRLIGDFAFAVIRRQSREIFLARDHIGARPLYWARRGDTLIFGTAIEAIVSLKEWTWRIDERIVAEHLMCPLTPVSKPLFAEIDAVPAGGVVTIRDGRAASRRWWRPSTKPVRRFKSDDEAVAACRALLERVVRDRINTEGAVGGHFSGGLDSTGVAVIAARALRESGRSMTRGYSWSPPVSEVYPADHARDERGLIQGCADKEGIPIRFGVADGVNIIDFTRCAMEFEGVADLADEVPVVRAAHEDGLRVMLSGWGGDEAFSAHGYGYLANLALTLKLGRAKRFSGVYRRLLLRRPLALFRLAWHQVLYPLLPGPLYRRLSPFRSYIRHQSYISGDLRRRHAGLASVRTPAFIKFGPNPNKNLMKHVTAGHITMRMESWAAWSGRFGFQYRYPLTDRRLIEFLFTLPPDQLFLKDRPRGLASAVLADYIPIPPTKDDIANERMRSAAREAFLRAMASEAANDGFTDDCPWLDKAAFLSGASSPVDQAEPNSVLAFAELMAAGRIWALYRRAARNGWL